MERYTRPRVVISKCIEFDSCRYNGDMIKSQAVRELKEYCDFIPVCPEVEIGLGVPRPSVRIVETDEKRILVSSATGEEYTQRIREFSEKFLSGLSGEIDGFLLKTSSPSCGYRDSKVYVSVGKGSSVRKNGSGFFSEKIDELFPDAVIETEGRLENFNIREEYYTKLFLAASFRGYEKEKSVKNLVEFHSKNKYLMMTYSSSILKRLGNITANRDGISIEELYAGYKKGLFELTSKNRKTGTNINVMMHILGYFSDKLTRGEKEFFLTKLEEYREKMIPLSVPISILEGWIIRFDEKYLKEQTIFTPFPKSLITVTDSGKGRENK